MKYHKFKVALNFHPVGQGLYASGHLFKGANLHSPPFFNWVYDCGTVSSNTLVHSASMSLAKMFTGSTKPRLDLVVVSHFDKDHISGLVNLLLNFHVGVLLMPYLVPWRRAGLVFGRGRYVSKRDRAFILDPVGTIAAMEGVEVDRIVWAVAGNHNSRPNDDDGDNDADNPVDRDDPPVLTFDEGVPENEWQEWELNPGTLNGIGSVSFLRPGGRLRIRGIWEFVPYQDPTIENQPDPSFLADASSKLEWLMKAPCEVFKDDVLKRLKRLYEARFTNGTQRNRISLFMYAGSLHDVGSFECGCAVPFAPHYAKHCFFDFLNIANVIYTGDGYLETPARLSNLFQYLGVRRTRQVLVFQVMHHGADGNWHAGMANRISPMLSIFSSDPWRGKRPHPHAKVKLDFNDYNPRQVDLSKGLSAAVLF